MNSVRRPQTIASDTPPFVGSCGTDAPVWIANRTQGCRWWSGDTVPVCFYETVSQLYCTFGTDTLLLFRDLHDCKTIIL
jgi:hypothetical protein